VPEWEADLAAFALPRQVVGARPGSPPPEPSPGRPTQDAMRADMVVMVMEPWVPVLAWDLPVGARAIRAMPTALAMTGAIPVMPIILAMTGAIRAMPPILVTAGVIRATPRVTARVGTTLPLARRAPGKHAAGPGGESHEEDKLRID
jgi:hypothetical protein